jgi:uncharacterized integral membrane protein (TIGR00697 family)
MSQPVVKPPYALRNGMLPKLNFLMGGHAVFNRRQQVYVWLAMIFLTSLLCANLTGSVLFSIPLPLNTPFGTKALLSSGIVPFPVTFILTDLINEFYGQAGARYVTFLGLGLSMLMYTYLSIIGLVPVDPVSAISKGQYLQFANGYTNMVLASLTAYLIGQLLDIQLFQLFHQWTGNRFIWLRATGSTVIAQLFDSAVVTTLAFWGSQSLATIAHIACSNYVWKFLIVLAITPLIYLGRAVLSRLLSPGYEDAAVSAEGS